MNLSMLKNLTLPHAIVFAVLVGAAVFAVHSDKVDPLLRALGAIAGLVTGAVALFMKPPTKDEP